MPMNFTYQGRKKLRLGGYNYSQNGYYFVTICTLGRICHFGEIQDKKMILSDMGTIVDEEIRKNIRDNINIDTYVIMPNHIHAIIIIQNARHDNKNVGCDRIAPKTPNIAPNNPNTGTMQSFPILSRMIRGLKGKITSRIQNEIKNGYEFSWQKSFFDVIIGNDEQLQKTQEYILDNPVKWEGDVNNQNNFT